MSATDSTADQISFDEFKLMLLDPMRTDEEIRVYLRVDDRDADPFNPKIRANPDLVRIQPAELQEEGLMDLGNFASNLRRKLSFELGGDKKVLVSEGDSWFQYPFLLDDIVDHLTDTYRIRSLGAAGDTADNMVFGSRQHVQALHSESRHVKAFLFSGAGNDIIGQGPDGEPMLTDLILNSAADRPEGYINRVHLGRTLESLRRSYLHMISDVRSIPGLSELPIVIHGYDYPFPVPASRSDERKSHWLRDPLDRREIRGAEMRRDVVKLLIDDLYDLLDGLASTDPRVFVVDLRGTLPNIADWHDEIHPTSEGFGRIAQKFQNTLAPLVG